MSQTESKGSDTDGGAVFHLRNVFLFLGILITSIGLVYFAVEFAERMSEWGRVLALGLVTTMFVSLGRHFEDEPGGSALVGKKGWRWLSVNTALYVIGLVAAFTAVIVFLGIDDLDAVWKLGATMALGLGLILWAAKRYGSGPTT